MVVICNACGRSVWFPDETNGTLQKCFYCNRETLVSTKMPRTENPLGLIAYEESAKEQSEPSPEPDVPEPPPVVLRPREAWGRRYLWLSLALIPLVFSLLLPRNTDDGSQRLSRTFSKLSRDEQRLVNEWFLKNKGKGSPSIDGLLAVLPGHRIEGAHLGRDSWFHWVYGGAAAVVFAGLLIHFFPSPTSKPANLIRAGLYTGTVGIFLLLAFQLAAEVSKGVSLRGYGGITGLFAILKLIGFSYASASDPSSGFLLSALGFTFGVGLCEEICKLHPATRRVRRWEKIDWRGVYLLGLASGMGFGISEGITYASGYNGIQTPGIYAVRFISCVALHAIWSGAASITLFNHQDDLQGVGTLENLWRLLRIIAVPMVLHGLYDTLLKKQMAGLALVAAILSFAWMAFQFERMRLRESTPELPVTG